MGFSTGIAFLGGAGRFPVVWKPQMSVFGTVSPPVQPPQGRSGRFRTHGPPSLQVRPGNHQVREAQERRKPLHIPLQPSMANHVAAERPLHNPLISGVSPDLFLLAVQRPARRRQVAIPPPPKRGCSARQRVHPGCTMPRPYIRLYSEIP